MRSVALHTLGCKVNYAETATIGRAFVGQGFRLVDFDDRADVYVINTCSVTARAERECRQIVRRALHRSPDATIVVTGCYAQLHPAEIAAIEGVDLILGTREKFDLFRLPSPLKKQPVPQIFVSCIDESDEFQPAFSSEADGRTRAFLKIQDGCDYQCSFCTIPLARGVSRSQPPDLLVRQAVEIAARGFREIVLTGVNVGDYGRAMGSSLLDLLRRLDRIDGIARIRISSIEPNLLTPPLIDFILGSEKCCDHFHVPLQSGSDPILRLMRRRYAARDYRRVVELIRSKSPDPGIGADVIVGFPGETDRHFDETRRLLADLPVTYLHVFTYSERPDTPAESYPGAVPDAARAERNETLRLLGAEKRRNHYSSFIGRNLKVLFERPLPEGSISGLSTGYVRVETNAAFASPNTLGDVLVTAIDDNCCHGIPARIPIQSSAMELR